MVALSENSCWYVAGVRIGVRGEARSGCCGCCGCVEGRAEDACGAGIKFWMPTHRVRININSISRTLQ